MKEASSTFQVRLLYQFAFAVMRVRNRLAVSTFATLGTYCLAVDGLVRSGLDPSRLWAESLLGRTQRTSDSLARLMGDLKAFDCAELVERLGRRGALFCLASKAWAALLLVATGIGHVVETVAFGHSRRKFVCHA